MLSAEQINEIHRLHWAEHWPVRKIARHLHIGRRTIAKYLAAPAQTAVPRQRASKLDPFKPTIAEFLEQDAHARATVIAQRLRPLGFSGGLSILKAASALRRTGIFQNPNRSRQANTTACRERSTVRTNCTWSSSRSRWTPNTAGVLQLLLLLTAREDRS